MSELPSSSEPLAASADDGARDTALPPATPRSDRRVDNASEESFPASDPPPFTRTRSGAANHAANHAADQAPVTVDAPGEARQWANALVEGLDAEELEAIGALLTEDVVVRWGDGPMLVGRVAALAHLERWFADNGVVDRHVMDVRGDEEYVFVELDVTGVRDGRSTTWPEAISARLRAGAASRLTVYGVQMVDDSVADPTIEPTDTTISEAALDTPSAVPERTV